jgi:hypothetical protein
METDPGVEEPSPPQPQAPPEAPQGVPPDLRRWAVIGLAIVAAVVIAAALLPPLLAKPPSEIPHPIAGTVTPTATITMPTTLGMALPPSPGGTTLPGTTPIPAITVATPAVTCVPSGPPGFTVTVSPVEASAARGETVNYQMTIDSQNCFSENVSIKLTASVLFILSNSYDLGTQTPPYPKIFEYALTVPDSLFPGATVDGAVTSTGGGITRENRLTLHVQ